MMKSEKHFIGTPKTAIVVNVGNASTAKNYWLVLHGYGQLAENFQSHFQNFDSQKNYFVIPNALNHFYLKSGKGDVGASWMTKYEREKDILDNNAYLNKVFHQFIKPYLNNEQRFYVLGFSQGAATLIRWLAMEDIKVDKIILWGSVFPPDMENERYIHYLKNFQWMYFIGSQDEFISNEEKEKQKHFFESHQFSIQWIEYEGKHNFNADVLHRYF
jgi:predicted esterase